MERFRELLDEQGVKWWPMHDVESGYHNERDTEFVANGRKHTAHEWGNGLIVYNLTPEQAVASVMGNKRITEPHSASSNASWRTEAYDRIRAEIESGVVCDPNIIGILDFIEDHVNDD